MVLDSALSPIWVAWALGLPRPAVVAIVAAMFLVLYGAFAVFGVVLRERLLPALGRGHVLYPQGPQPGQVHAEFRRSLMTVAVFGALAVVTLWAATTGIVRVRFEASFGRVVVDWLLIFLWNELHFYVCHRSLHLPRLMKAVHRVHHASRVPTPWSTYSFHWFEALLLGSVMLSGMLLRDFHYSALIFLPVLSIAVNVLGHLNYEPFPHASKHSMLSMARRHGLHHEKYTSHFGFLTPGLDDLFGTGIPQQHQDLRWPDFVSGWKRFGFGLLLVVLTSGTYVATNHLRWTAPYELSPTLVEASIPVMPWTAWIYVTYPLIFLAAYLSETDTGRIHRYFYAIIAVNVLSELCFVAFPTTIPRFEIGLLANDLSSGAELLRAVHAVDTPANCVPSLHVSTSVLAALTVMQRGKRLLTVLFWLWALSIALSTLTTHQHHLVDVLCGAGLAWGCFVFCRDRLRAPEAP